MSVDFYINTGTSAYADPSEVLSELAFGARYTSYRDVDRFLDQTNDTGLGLIIWPGGTLAETRDDRYGFDFDELYNPGTGKPTITDMMAIAVEEGTALSIILPTARYADDHAGLQSDLQEFLGDLLGGTFGPMPEKLILEVGNEYYANFSNGATSKAAQYGEIAELTISEIALALADPAVNTTGSEVVIAAQAGKTMADDIEIRDALSDFALSSIDMITHHRFAYLPQGVAPKIDELEPIVEAWEDDVTEAGGDEPNLFVSAWNTVTLTRNEMLSDFIAEEAAKGNTIDPETVDLDGRTTTEFEEYWQDRLADAAYGQEHAAYVLESFASYAEAGMDGASVYGVDLVHPGRLSWREDGTDYQFAGGEMLKMLYESVEGTHVLQSSGDYSRDDPVTAYGFENDDKLVLFLAAGRTAPGEVNLDMAGLGTTYHCVWAESLTSETPADWMNIFGVPDNAAVDESAEAETYAVAVREAITPDLSDDDITLTFTEPYEIVRLSFAKSAAGAAEIAGWASGDSHNLSGPLLPPTDPYCHPPEPEGEEDGEIEFTAMAAEAAGMGSGVGLLFLLLFFL